MTNIYNILIAEDAPVQGKKLKYVLEKFDYQVTWCINGQLAFDELKNNPTKYSLIISDYQMPELDGLQFLQEIKKLPDDLIKKIPFILLTTIEDENVFFNSLEFGANEFLNKPFRAEELKLRCKNLILLYEYQKLIEHENQDLSVELQRKNEILKENFERLEKAHHELQTMQEQLIVASKLASLGTMGAGVAHEINNPLTIIQNYNKKLRNILEDENFDREKMISINDTIGKGVTRIKTIVEHLKQFSDSDLAQKEKMVELKIVDLIEGLKDFYGGILEKYNINFIKVMPETQFSILGYKSAVEHILLNILHNAVDALADQAEKEMKIVAYVETTNETQRGVIELWDNGPGMPLDVQKKIFDPFFTTKETGKGTGLGMSLVKAYIKDCEAEISLRSKPGETIFILKFKIA
jgi:C4-dicarboxylate-specific signal transduction histidine kinase